MEEVKHLLSFLTSSFPDDVLMPVVDGTKRPMFPHKDNAWCWDKFVNFLKEHYELWLFYKTPSVCVILRDLCVIDVDNEDKATELEARFPILRTVPCEETKRGKHYWFVRSDTADAFGYHDGAAQREKDVDFKSVHTTGTGGIVVVAPSTGKEWVRPLWNTFVPEIPDELLDAVALPSATGMTATLRFEDGEMMMVRDCKWLHAIAYFSPFVDGSLPSDTSIPVPCRKEVFEELVCTMEKNEIRGAEPSVELFKGMISVADKLGVTTKMASRLVCGRPILQLDTYLVCPDWWRAYHTEREWCSAGGKTDDGLLVHVDFELASKLMYEPLKRDERWLFSGLKPCVAEEGFGVLCDDPVPYVWHNLPTVVSGILHKYQNHLVLAGGAVLGLVSNYVDEGADYDFFVVGLPEDRASAMLDEILSTHLKDRAIIRTERAVTIVLEGGPTLQIIMRTHECVGQVLLSFDLAPCKVAAWVENNTFKVMCAPSWVPAMRHMAFAVDIAIWGRATPLRILKYYHKGFDVFVPCNYMDARKEMASPSVFEECRKMIRLFWTYPPKKTGLIALFNEITQVERLRAWYNNTITNRITEYEFQSCVRNLEYTSDYGELAQLQNRVQYVVSAFLGVIWIWYHDFSSSYHTVYQELDEMEVEVPWVWHRADPSRTCMGMFNPTDAGMREVFDTSKFAAHLGLDLHHDLN